MLMAEVDGEELVALEGRTGRQDRRHARALRPHLEDMRSMVTMASTE